MRPLALATVVVLAACACNSSSPSQGGGPTDAGAAGDGDAALPSFDFTAMQNEEFGGTWQTDGVVVLYQGQIVFEQYANGYTSSMRHITYSVSKSVGAALVGLAIQDGLMKPTDSVCTYVTPPTGADPTLCDTTIDDLLHMTSGLTWSENYVSDPTTSDVLQMLYGQTADMGAFVATHTRAAPHATRWSYSSGDADLLADAFRFALEGQDARAYAQQKLFAPAGITTAAFEADKAGTLVFSSFLYMSPRDMASFGQLYLTDGMNGATRVLPAGWVAYSIAPAGPVAQPTPRVPDAGPGNSGGSYGASLWLNAASPSASPDTWLYPQIPIDAFSAEGHYGQKIFIVPSRHLVVARTGNDRDPIFDPGPMVQAAVAAVDQAVPR
jgi:CubicO group peptidase (beta-lactamase class C family)